MSSRRKGAIPIEHSTTFLLPSQSGIVAPTNLSINRHKPTTVVVHRPTSKSVKIQRKIGNLSFHRHRYRNNSPGEWSSQIRITPRWKDGGRFQWLTEKSHPIFINTIRNSRNLLQVKGIERIVRKARWKIATVVKDSLLFVTIHRKWEVNYTPMRKFRRKIVRGVAENTKTFDSMLETSKGGTLNTHEAMERQLRGKKKYSVIWKER